MGVGFLTSMHICKDQGIFETLHTNGDFDSINVGNNQKLKIEGMGSVHLKLYNDKAMTFYNVRHVATMSVNMFHRVS